MAGGGGHSCVMEKGWKGQDRKVGSGDEMHSLEEGEGLLINVLNCMAGMLGPVWRRTQN